MTSVIEPDPIDWSDIEAMVAEPAGQEVQEGDSWQPVDLGPYLRGEVVRPEPTVGMARSDGLRLLYPGKEHTVVGEMESGKSWFMLGCAAAELVAGHHVVYIHFEESDPGDTVERLVLLDVPQDAILELFHFVGPEHPATAERLAGLLSPVPSLVILDGINEAMSLHRLAIREEDGAAEFRRRIVKPFTRAGAAVLGADHVVKDREKRDRGPLGSIHKGNALSGTLIMLENAEPFGRGQKGRSHVFVTKDRPGVLRRHGRADRRIPGKTFMGEMVVDDTRLEYAWLSLRLWAPAQERPVGEAEVPVELVPEPTPEIDEAVFAAALRVIERGEEPSTRMIKAEAHMGFTKAADALARLKMAGRLIETAGPRNARLYSLPTASSGVVDQ